MTTANVREDERSRLIDQIARVADMRAAVGVQIVHVRCQAVSFEELVESSRRTFEPRGFVAVRSDADLAESRRFELCHRHVLLFACGDSDSVITWIRDLARASPRAHLLVLAHEGVHGTSMWRASRRPEVREGGTPHAGRALDLIASGALARAEAELHAAVAEAAVEKGSVAPRVQAARAQLYFWQGRFESAVTVLAGAADQPARLWRALSIWARDGTREALRTALRNLPPSTSLGRLVTAQWWLANGYTGRARRMLHDAMRGSEGEPPLLRALRHWMLFQSSGMRDEDGARDAIEFVRATGAQGICRWGLGRRSMNVLTGVTKLLQVVHEAEDELHALKSACAWLRREVPADAAGVASSDGLVIVSDGFARAEWEAADLREAVRSPAVRTIVEGPHALAVSPLRYAGTPIGTVVVKGARLQAETLADAASAFASACAPALRARLDALACVKAADALTPEIVGRSPAILALRETIARIAQTTFPVLIEGESGTGKELVARALHRLSPRRDRRFSALNCAALNDDLAESELFGHARGAFTGALNARAGLFEDAHGGTLFLDEVGELSPRAQAKLLRVLQEREIRRLGEPSARPIDVRVVAATNVPLIDAAEAGRFRPDLRFRLSVIRIVVPPLRDRIEDVPLLAQAFWRPLVDQTQKRVRLGPDALAALCHYRWPGNIRELQNAMAGLAIAAPSYGRVTARHVRLVLNGLEMPAEQAAPLDTARRALERRMVVAALARHGGRQIRAARDLGLSRQGLSKAIKRLGLGYHRQPSAELRPPAARDDRPGPAGRRDARVFTHPSRAG